MSALIVKDKSENVDAILSDYLITFVDNTNNAYKKPQEPKFSGPNF